MIPGGFFWIVCISSRYFWIWSKLSKRPVPRVERRYGIRIRDEDLGNCFLVSLLAYKLELTDSSALHFLRCASSNLQTKALCTYITDVAQLLITYSRNENTIPPIRNSIWSTLVLFLSLASFSLSLSLPRSFVLFHPNILGRGRWLGGFLWIP